MLGILVPFGDSFACRLHILIVISWPYSVLPNTSENFLRSIRPDQLASIILVIAEHSIMRRDRWRVLKLLHDCLLILCIFLACLPMNLTLGACKSLVHPVLPWTRSFISVAAKASLEPFNLGCEACIWLDQLDAKLLNSKIHQCLGILHVLFDLIKTICVVVTSRTC